MLIEGVGVPCSEVHLLLCLDLGLGRSNQVRNVLFRTSFFKRLCRSPSSLLTGNRSFLRALCHPFRALAPGGGRRGLGGEDGHSLISEGYYSRKIPLSCFFHKFGKRPLKTKIPRLWKSVESPIDFICFRQHPY